ncbi:MAG: hypothetical protein KKA64_02360 [Nanoarchaeota archaeon]|nr:hypothetical protein [Nanoarchaeota archaeon]
MDSQKEPDAKKEPSFNEQRIRSITNLYYSRPDIQKAIFEFCKNREVVPRYFEGFGKRPDSFQYQGDIFEMVKRGATSFHCSEEIWKSPMEISTSLNPSQFDELRQGWDLLIDIDSKYIDYSKIAAKLIVELLRFHGIKSVELKFSGSKGFHLIVPWQAFPLEINSIKTSNMFPEWPRIIVNYINEKIHDKLVKEITKITSGNKYIRDEQASKQVIPDLILVSPRHLFRTPYSLHEKTALASIVIDKDKIENFQVLDANPIKAKVKNFYPDAKRGEASELLMQALDWYREKTPDEELSKTTQREFKPIKLSNLSETNFPPCIKKILQGMQDGKKRALFVLINLFRTIGMEKEELEKRISEWNKKNEHPLQEGYIKSQLIWSYRNKQVLPPNCREYYQGLGVCIPDDLCSKVKNPVNYVVRKNTLADRQCNNNSDKSKSSSIKKENKSEIAKTPE